MLSALIEMMVSILSTLSSDAMLLTVVRLMVSQAQAGGNISKFGDFFLDKIRYL